MHVFGFRLPKLFLPLAITFFFVLIRLVYIFRFPLMEAEASDIRYGLLSVTKPGLLFASFQYASKQPLAYWLFGSAAALSHNVEVVPRLVSLLFGVITLLFTFLTTRKIASYRIALFAVVLSAILPGFIHFQSLALMESIVMATTAVSLWSFMEFIHSRRLFYASIFGMSAVAAFWTKTNAVIPCILLYLFMIIYTVSHKPFRFQSYFPVLFIPVFICIFTIPLIIQPGFISVTRDVSVFTFSFSELMRFPVGIWLSNVTHVILSLVYYGGPIFPFLIVLGWGGKFRKYFILLFVFAIVIALMPVFFNKVMSSRYYISAYIPFVMIAAAGAGYIFEHRRKFFVYAGIIFTVFTVLTDSIMVGDARVYFRLFPPDSPLVTERGYALGWSSGYASRDAVVYLQNSPGIPRNILIGLQDFPGNPTDYIIASYYFSPDRETILINKASDIKTYSRSMKIYPLYFVSRSNLNYEDLKPYMTKLASYRSPDSEDYVEIYKIDREPEL